MSSCTWLSGLPQKLHLFISLFFLLFCCRVVSIKWLQVEARLLFSWLLFLSFASCFWFSSLAFYRFLFLAMENIRSTCCHEAYFSLVVSVAGFFMSTVSTMPYSFASGAVIQ